jgi:hypothetical protein
LPFLQDENPTYTNFDQSKGCKAHHIQNSNLTVHPFFVSGLRSEQYNLPRCTLAESGPNVAKRHTTHSACSYYYPKILPSPATGEGSPEHALGHVAEVGHMWFLTHVPLSALCCHTVNTVELDSDYSGTGHLTITQLAISNNVSTINSFFLIRSTSSPQV